MSIVIVTVLVVILAFFIAKSIYVSNKSKETETTLPEPRVQPDQHIQPYVPTPRLVEEPIVVDEPVVVTEEPKPAPTTLGSDNVPTKPKPKKKPAKNPTAKMSAAPKKVTKTKANA